MKTISNMQIEFDVDIATELANNVLIGLNLKDCEAVMGLDKRTMIGIVAHPLYLKVIYYAKALAKRQLLATQYTIATDAMHRDCQKAGQHLLASRFKITPDSAEHALRDKHHRDNIDLKRQLATQYADIQVTRIINNSSVNQLETLINSKDLLENK